MPSTHRQLTNLNAAAIAVGVTSIVTSLIFVLVVRFQFSDIHSQAFEASQDFQQESLNMWQSLREVHINPNILRNRRETFRKLLGRPLSTSSNVGFIQSRTKLKIKAIGTTDKHRKKNNRKTKETKKPSTPVAPKFLSFGTPTEKFGGYYAPPKPIEPSYQAEAAAYETQPKDDVYEASSTAAYSPPAAVSSYAGTFDEAQVDEPSVEFQWEQIKPSTCSCRSDNQCPMGPPGPKGAAGYPGEPGEEGRAGERGKRGEDAMAMNPPLAHCVMCPQGQPGPTGVQGKRGNRGLRGARGGEGAAGRNGHPGFPGLHGPEGPPGVEGEMGAMGAPGMDSHAVVGLPGAKGTIGEPGDVGRQGDPGLDGMEGLIGMPGNRGAVGNPGRRGSNGTNGEIGLEGDPGQDGEYCLCPRNRQYDTAANRLV